MFVFIHMTGDSRQDFRILLNRLILSRQSNWGGKRKLKNRQAGLDTSYLTWGLFSISLVAQTVKRLSTMREIWVGKFPGEGKDNPLQYSCLENPRGRAAWCPWGQKESDTTERLHFHFVQHNIICIGLGRLMGPTHTGVNGLTRFHFALYGWLTAFSFISLQICVYVCIHTHKQTQYFLSPLQFY